MITVPTVLILGAGASMEYGFPSGLELKWRIIDSFRNPLPQVLEILQYLGTDREAALELSTALHLSGGASIDAFLEHRTDLLTIGKIAIALNLCPLEKEKNLFAKGADESGLYQYLANYLNTTFDHFEDNKLSVISYNYDRSFEHYLFTSLLHRYGKSPKEVAAKVNKIKVLHLHGNLGYLPWQDPRDDKLTRGFAGDQTGPGIEIAMKGIKVIHESEVARDKVFQEAHDVLGSARKVIFLGFGYHQTNVDRILPALGTHIQILAGTCCGLKQREISKLTNRVFNNMGFRAGDGTQISREFLREKIELE